MNSSVHSAADRASEDAGAEDEPSSIRLPQERPRLKGILAFLPDTVSLYGFDPQHSSFRQPMRRRRRREDSPIDAPCDDSSPKTVSTSDWILNDNASSAVVFALLDPTHQYSQKVRQLLVQLMDLMTDETGVSSLKAIGLMSSAAAVRSEDEDSFYRHTGFALAPLTSMLSTTLSLSQVPTIAVVDVARGAKISCSHEELALEWNHLEVVADRWTKTQSALSATQQVAAAAIFPSCAIM